MKNNCKINQKYQPQNEAVKSFNFIATTIIIFEILVVAI